MGCIGYFGGYLRNFWSICRIFGGNEVDFSIMRSHTGSVQEDEDCPDSSQCIPCQRGCVALVGRAVWQRQARLAGWQVGWQVSLVRWDGR